MKLCFIGIEVVPYGKNTFVGGHRNNMIRIAREMTKRGHQVRIVTTDMNNVLNGPKFIEDIFIQPVPTVGSNVSSIKTFFVFSVKALKLAIRLRILKKIDIIHTHSGHPILCLLATIIGKSTSLQSIHTFYSPFFDSKKNLNFFTTVLSLRFISQVIVPSENVRRMVVRLGCPQEKITLIPPVVNINEYNLGISGQAIRNGFNILEDVPVILYCGSWTKWKGLEYLVQAMSRVIKDVPDAKLVIAYGETYNIQHERKSYIQKRIERSGLENSVIELGIIHNLPELLSASDMVVAPFLNLKWVSDYPLILLEAMACGKPVITTNVGGIPEFVNSKVGILVQPSDSRALATSILYLINNKKIAKTMGQNGNRIVASKFSVRANIEKIENMYLE